MAMRHIDENPVETKIAMLYEFCVLTPQVIKVRKKSRTELPDEREPAVRKILEQCTNEIQMEQVLHDIVVGRKSLNTMLKQKGLM